ncbi:iron-compound ABC transporter iron-compound-binding protein [Streptococcus pneumoniae]|nr:iron-compound ABC transporter iron-compound-binding protein [Streptococcus pneumoniae]
MKTSLKLYFTALVASFLLLLGACSTNSSTSQTETSSSAPTEVTIKSSLGRGQTFQSS